MTLSFNEVIFIGIVHFMIYRISCHLIYLSYFTYLFDLMGWGKDALKVRQAGPLDVRGVSRKLQENLLE